MNITRRLSPSRTIGRNGLTPDLIVIHTTGGTFTSAVNTVLNAANQVSYHFIISATGEIVQAVDIENMAWANGTTNNNDARDNRHSALAVVRERRINANLYSVSIGLGDMPTGMPSAAQMNALVWLIGHIRAEVERIYRLTIPFARTNIVGHDEITPIHRPDCPGRRFPWDDLISRLADAEKCELLGKLEQLRTDLERWTDNSRIKFAWVDSNMPEWARPTIHKLTQRRILFGDEHGRLNLSNDMLRLFVALDRAGVFE